MVSRSVPVLNNTTDEETVVTNKLSKNYYMGNFENKIIVIL